MHSFTKKEKAIIKAIANQDIKDIQLIGTVIKDIAFPSNECALYVNAHESKAFLFFPCNEPYDHQDRVCFARLISILNLIDYLEKENLIYIQDSALGAETMFYEGFEHSFVLGKSEGPDVKHRINRNEVLLQELSDKKTELKIPGQGILSCPTIIADHYFIAGNNKAPYLQSTNVSSLYNRIYKYMCGRAFPTEALTTFIGNRYCTTDESLNRKSLNLSKISFIVAIAALICALPIVTNKYSKSTLVDDQFDSIIKAIECKDNIKYKNSCESIKDTINQKDTTRQETIKITK